MPAEPLFFDSSYLVRLYLEDLGYVQVRQLAESAAWLAASWHCQAEIVAALHRAYREGRFSATHYRAAVEQFSMERHGRGFRWYDLNEPIQARLENVFPDAPATTFLRSADALHLACAAEHGFTEVYSNDRRFLAAASLFGLRGIDVIQ